MTRNKLYLLLGVLTTVSYAYVAWAFRTAHKHNNITFCAFKNVTGIACPSCGSTRSVLLITKGKIAEAGFMNPFGYIIALLMITIPFWLFYDIIFKKDSLYKNYRHTETILSGKWVAITLIILVSLNWIWNIHKDL